MTTYRVVLLIEVEGDPNSEEEFYTLRENTLTEFDSEKKAYELFDDIEQFF